jgi:hypothetical protein
MGIYLEGTPSSSLASTFHSLTVKGCYQLGLHFMGSNNHSHLDQEIRRRLWYLCVMNDRYIYILRSPSLVLLSSCALDTDTM